MNKSEEDLFASLEATFMAVEVEDKVTPTPELSDMDLLDEFAEVQSQLTELQQLTKPYTQEARDLHSRNNALILEMQKRGFT